ncbi:hypothetical protein N7490_002732 [Penicillium lividum]|nr:hypothetical protein N7490_002732 [Penicillium lividum]
MFCGTGCDHDSTDPPNIEFNITNFNGAFPPINQRYPSAPNTPVQTSLNQYTLPSVAQDAATLLASANHGRAFEIWIVTPDDSSHFGSQQFNLGWAAEGCTAGSIK